MKKKLALVAIAATIGLGFWLRSMSFKESGLDPAPKPYQALSPTSVPQAFESKVYSPTPSFEQLPTEMAGIVGSYTDEDLTAALDDYFNVSPLGEASSEYVDLLRNAFETNKIGSIDAAIHNFLFDNGISRQEKIRALWAFAKESWNIPARRDYLLGTLSSLRPVELAEDVMTGYRQSCSDESCYLKLAAIMVESLGMVSAGYQKFSEQQLSYITQQAEPMVQLIENEIVKSQDKELTNYLLSHATAVLGHDKAIELIEEKFQALEKNEADDLVPRYVQAVIGSPDVNIAAFSEMVARIGSVQKEEPRREALRIVYTALQGIPLKESQRKALIPLLERSEPASISGVDYMEWLAAYSIVQSPPDDQKARDSFLTRKLLASAPDAKVSAVLYGWNYLGGLSNQEKKLFLSDIENAMATLPADSEKRKSYETAVTRLREG